MSNHLHDERHKTGVILSETFHSDGVSFNQEQLPLSRE